MTAPRADGWSASYVANRPPRVHALPRQPDDPGPGDPCDPMPPSRRPLGRAGLHAGADRRPVSRWRPGWWIVPAALALAAGLALAAATAARAAPHHSSPEARP